MISSCCQVDDVLPLVPGHPVDEQLKSDLELLAKEGYLVAIK